MRYFLCTIPSLVFASLIPFGCSTDGVEVVAERCGNSVIEEPEICDGDTAQHYCSTDCLVLGGFCGDGIVEPEFGEQCDDLQLTATEGEGGAGGAGGASAGGDNKGCKNCRSSRGYLCDTDNNTCQQTGVDADEKAVDHIEELCEWFIGLSGGEGFVLGCMVEGEARYYTAATQEVCEDSYEVNDDCTIGEMESWARSKDSCEIRYEPSPCDP